MRYFPLFFDLHGKRVLLVGGGEVARRKAELLTRAQARLRVVAPQIEPALARLITTAAQHSTEKDNNARHDNELLHRPYHADDINDCTLVVSATDDDALNRRVSADAKARRVPVNVVDSPALCDFIFPAIIDRSPLVAAVSSSGASPVLARRVRAKIEALLPTAAGNLARFCARFRDTVKNALPMQRRRIFWEETLDGDCAAAVLAGDEQRAEMLLRERLHAFAKSAGGIDNDGEVYLIGAGCGEADMLTFHAMRLLQRADVVVHDRLVAKSVLELARRDAEKIYVGKRRDCHLATQDDINALLIDRARRGLRVARLKGGDPFIFGRGGEERETLTAAGVRVQVAAGITAAIGAAAAAGIPLTYRNVARGVRFCTAYRDDLNSPSYWRKLADDGDSTLVFYMAGASLRQVAANLIKAGRAADTPTAVICAGATAAQRIVSGVLGDIADRGENLIFSPALIIVGDVVALRPISTSTAAVEKMTPPFLDISGKEQYAFHSPITSS